MTRVAAAPSPRWSPAIVLSLISGVGIFLVMHALAYMLVGGFEHMLDDVYIHLAMAAEIARGGYGVNADEPTSAASSILYPILLTPFAGSEVQRMLPVFWNALGVIAACWLWGAFIGRLVGAVPKERSIAILLAILGPLSLHLGGIGFVGMEHALQIAATMAVVYGLSLFVQEGRPGWILVAGIVLGPVLRLENIGVSGMACAVLLFCGRPRLAILIGIATLLPLLAFGAYLSSLGLDPVPNSIRTKFAGGGGLYADQPILLRFLLFLVNISQYIGAFILGLCGLWVVFGLACKPFRQMPNLAIWMGIVAVGFAHLVFGRVGELHRYEVYVVVWMLGLSLLLVAPYLFQRTALGSGLRAVLLLILLAGFVYYPGTVGQYGPVASRSIHLQQNQMARFVRDYLKAPVAVNDLGRVVWNNPYYVLDLWGLASSEALAIRRSNPASGWAEPLADKHGVVLAMVYDSWLGDAIGPGWVRVGTLVVTVPTAGASDNEVAFYATDAGEVDRINGLLTRFAQTLPPDVRFRFEAPTSPGE